MKHAAIGPISVYYPGKAESNEELDREFPDWGIDLIYSKTGIANRYVAAENECSSDLAVKATEKLFAENDIDPASIDYVLLCTQTPDYPLPTTSCLIQDRLGLRTDIGAFDFNLGCSGYVYGLSMAEGLIQSGAAKRILFLTAETYSKYIDRTDRSLRTIFSDAAAATLIESSDEKSVGAFQFGTDGSGGDTLLVAKGGMRPIEDAIKPRHRHRWPSALYMDGPSLISFPVGAVPGVIDEILKKAELKKDDIELFLMHQATRKMLNLLQERLELDGEQLPIRLENCGNTVSSTIPILIDDMRKEKKIKKDAHQIMIGFGVGWSWAGCVWQDILCPTA